MSDQPLEQADWIRRVLAEHEPALLRYALRLTGNAELARDVVQETFLRLCRAEVGTVDCHVGPWLFRVCRQRALDQARKEQRMPASTSTCINGYAAQEPGPAERVERQETGEGVVRLLAALPANQQEVVRLKFQAGLSYREISEVTGLSVSNVGFLLHTALARLRANVAACDERATHNEEPNGQKGHTL
jgi:RNA polymerase sigma factor (sigma-70 family)